MSMFFTSYYVITALLGHEYVFILITLLRYIRLYLVMSMFLFLLRYYVITALLGHEYVFHSYYVITLLRYYGFTWS